MDLKVFSHISDYDGHGCAALLMYHYMKKNAKFDHVKYYMVDYDNKINTDFINKKTIVFMTDISTDPETMKALKEKAYSFIWIDHHQTAIDANKGEVYDGIQVDNKNMSAIGLLWKYLYPNDPAPLAVSLLSKYDVFDKRDLDYWERFILPFQYGMSTLDTDMRKSDNYKVWRDIFSNKNGIVETIIEEGRIIANYEKRKNARLIKSAAMFVEVFGIRIAVANAHGNSLLFDSIEDDSIDAYCRYAYNAIKDKWAFSIYSSKPDIDVSKIASYFGGGGHPNAAGFGVDSLDDFFGYDSDIIARKEVENG